MKTDTQVRQDVITALQWESTVNSKQLDVIVNSGIVTLQGYVGSYIEKWDAGRATQRVHGVRGLSSELVVILPEENKRNDMDIALAAVNVLRWMSYLPKNCIRVDVNNAWITLSGEVEREFQRQAVRGTVRFLLGVKGVIDHIVVKPVGAASPSTSFASERVPEHKPERAPEHSASP